MRRSRTLSPAPSVPDPAASHDDAGRSEPVVTYSRLAAEADEAEALHAAESGRIEPRLNVVALGREAPHREVPRREPPPRLDAVRSDPRLAPPPVGAPRVPVDDIVGGLAHDHDDAPPPRARSRAAPRIALLVGLVALLAGAGVLAATFSGLLRGSPTVAAVPPTAVPDAALVGSIDGAEDAAAPALASGDVRVVGPHVERSPAETTTTALAVPDAAADGAPADTAGEAPGRIIAEPPLPRLRPPQAVATVADPATTFGAPPVLAPGPGYLTPPPGEAPAVLAPGPANLAAPAPATAGESDADALMADVERILAERRAAQQGGTTAGPGEPLYGPPPGGDFAPVDSGFAAAEPLPPLQQAPGRYRPILPGDVLPTPPAAVPQGGLY